MDHFGPMTYFVVHVGGLVGALRCCVLAKKQLYFSSETRRRSSFLWASQTFQSFVSAMITLIDLSTVCALSRPMGPDLSASSSTYGKV